MQRFETSHISRVDAIRRRRRGVTIVEFALTFPLLMLLVIGLLELARLNLLRHAADGAAYEAARNVIVPGATVSEAVAEANDLLKRAGIKGSTIAVTPTVITEATPQVTVQVSVPLSQNSWLPPALTGPRTVTRQVSLITERVAVMQAKAIAESTPVATPTPSPPAPSSGKSPQLPVVSPGVGPKPGATSGGGGGSRSPGGPTGGTGGKTGGNAGGKSAGSGGTRAGGSGGSSSGGSKPSGGGGGGGSSSGGGGSSGGSGGGGGGIAL